MERKMIRVIDVTLLDFQEYSKTKLLPLRVPASLEAAPRTEQAVQ